MAFLIKTLIYCLTLTILLETLFAVFVGIRGRKNLLTVILVQVVTNPCAVLGMLWFMSHVHWYHALYELPIEALVVLTEWLIHRKFLKDIKRPFAFSLAANYFSFSFGIVLNYFNLSPHF